MGVGDGDGNGSVDNGVLIRFWFECFELEFGIVVCMVRVWG